ncbi:receptor like protein 56 [Rhynchospora pubera]|uniref:Receptor like protein 56 n=1 Tax=Rhynchospora pubera TaxID=906938 RepID=A0AAV8AID6_9POAL|nr:receptor like protein 56 [Rhynchospora pubera]
MKISPYLIYLTTISVDSGEVPNDIITKLPNLSLLNLSKNYFQGHVPWESMKNLFTLDLSSNYITDDIQKIFSMSSDYLISYLDLSNNKFYGSFTNMTNLFAGYSSLIFSNNNISGELPLGICNTSFEVLDISNNKLTGVLPDCIGRADIWALKLSANYLEGSLPSEICAKSSRWLLDLSDNKLSGSIPPCSNGSSLQIIDLSKNNLSGNFPISWLNIPDLKAIDIGKNHLSGELPIWNGSESNLKVLLARDNTFGGPISEHLCQFKYLRILDLSHNNLFGQIPSCIFDMGLKDDSVFFLGIELAYSFGIGELNYTNFLLHISKSITLDRDELPNFGLELMSKGRFDLYWSQILLLERIIDLSSNKLVGNIPEEIGQMTWLITLNLSNNYLTGAIPDSVSKLRQLLSLDLSHNSLTGQIPRELTKLTSLEVFSVAYNNLSGPTLDLKAQFGTFDNRSYEGNPNLCGPPLSKSCFSYHDTKLPSQNKTGNDQGGESINFLILFGSFALFFVVSFWGLITVLYFKSNWRYGLFNLVDEYGDMIYVRVVLFVRKIRAAQRNN